VAAFLDFGSAYKTKFIEDLQIIIPDQFGFREEAF
jgi:Ser/Thr protein kinase RdoA (MazF antagonist)